jgi:cell filamentation protein, protein adenylyltransferase
VFGQLAAEKHLRGLIRESFVDRVTHYFAEINAIHPFREGNGRTQRAFFAQLSQEAGWHLRWAGAGSGAE